MIEIVRVIDDMPVDFHRLRAEAAAEGVRNMDLLARQWADGANRFDGQGEALFAAFVDGELAGVGGVSAETGLAAMRMRRLYVRPSFRRRGVASALAAAMIQQGLQGARLLTVNAAASLAAPPFWEALGFRRSGRAGVTHQLEG